MIIMIPIHCSIVLYRLYKQTLSVQNTSISCQITDVVPPDSTKEPLFIMMRQNNLSQIVAKAMEF